MYYDITELIGTNPILYRERDGSERPLTDTERVERIREMMGHPYYTELRQSSAILNELLGHNPIVSRKLYGVEVVLDDTKRLKELRKILSPILLRVQ